MMIGADGRQYGPITLDQLKTWVGEGRITRETSILRSDTNSRLPAAQYTELGLAQPAAAPAVLAPAVPTNNSALERQIKSGASWFFLIAGLSLVNSIVASTGSGWRFVVGLGVTQIIDGIGSGMAGAGTAISLALAFVVTGIFAGVGIFARKRQAWAFIVGMVLYGLDCALLIILGILYTSDWLSIGFHVFALYCIFAGLRACNRLKALERGLSVSPQ